jgi:hypothetical protein
VALASRTTRQYDDEEKANIVLPVSQTKTALEALLRERTLMPSVSYACSGDRRLASFVAGIPALDRYWGGGVPRGQVSEIWGPPSSGRTALACVVAAMAIQTGNDVAWIDPGDTLDPAAATSAGVDLERLFWLRGGPGLPRTISATATILGSGIFELVVLDLSDLSAFEAQRLPASTWLRFQRLIEGTPVALLILGRRHLFRGPLGFSLELRRVRHRWQGVGPGRLLGGVAAEATLAAGTRAPAASSSTVELERIAGR